jgi:hypothetical protein
MKRTDSTHPAVAKSLQGELPPELLDRLREIIGGCRWRYAGTQFSLPYWYRTPLIDAPLGHIDVDQLLTFADAIETYGYNSHFKKRAVRYLNVDGFRYFPINVDRSDPIQGVMNRTKLPGLDQAAIRGDDPVDDRGIRIKTGPQSEKRESRSAPDEEDDEAYERRQRKALRRFLKTQDASLRSMVGPEDFDLREIRRFQLDIPEETLAAIRSIIEAGTWTFASSMPWIPHFYVVRGKTLPYNLFVKLAIWVRHYGYDANHGYGLHRYLDVDGLRYWTMGAPLDETTILNRARITPPAVPAERER